MGGSDTANVRVVTHGLALVVSSPVGLGARLVNLDINKGYFACSSLVLYGIRLLAQASLGKLSTNERGASTILDQ